LCILVICRFVVEYSRRQYAKSSSNTHIERASRGGADMDVVNCQDTFLSSIDREMRGDTVRIGLLADIHNEHELLEQAIRRLTACGVQQFITLGDTLDLFLPVAGSREVVNLLRDVNTVGVWGNHDFMLCHEVPEKIHQKYPAAVVEFMATMQPQLNMDGHSFSHRSLLGDPHDNGWLWGHFDDLTIDEETAESLRQVPHARQFVGHRHCWYAANSAGRLEWAAGDPLALHPDDRYFIVVHAVADGWCALLDTDAATLQPIRLDGAARR
jgi:hypothetical protein